MPNLTVQSSNQNTEISGSFTGQHTTKKVRTPSLKSEFIPDENYKVLFRTSNPVDSYDYSGVLVELNTNVKEDGSTLQGGYKVIGYNTLRPFFKVFEPVKNGNANKIEIGTANAVVYNNWQTDVKTITYGTVFETIQQVVDFLVGYGKSKHKK